jgi:hypothetical protein
LSSRKTITRLRVPTHVKDLGIPAPVVHDLVLRRALFEGRTSSLNLATSLGLSPALMVEVVEELRSLRWLEVLGLEGRDYQLTLTEAGRAQANDRLQLCRYAGIAPVPLASYTAVVRAQHADPPVTLASLRTAFADLVVGTPLLDELGPSLLAEGAVFLYGPPGTGKTSIAERFIRIHTDAILVPHAVEVDSQIITVFDPVVHEALADQPADLDPRWVLCRRPAIIAGGELQLSQLDLTFEASSGVYVAPLQMQANNGVFVIDDFGRQQGLTPESLLNRWIVPLDRRVDYLSLSYGLKFQIPFDVKVVFSTNLSPSSLGDEAFFRRIQNKILVPPISDEEFDKVLGRVTTELGIAVAPDAPAYLRRMSRERGDGDLRPYLPREICRILRSVCRYHGNPEILDRDTVDRVVSVYFTRTADMMAPAPAPAPAPPAAPAPTFEFTPEPAPDLRERRAPYRSRATDAPLTNQSPLNERSPLTERSPRMSAPR